VCAEGSFLNDDNECEKRRARKPVAAREKPEPRRAPEARSYAPEPRSYRGPQVGQAAAGRYQGRDPSIGASGRPLTGLERQQGCTGYQAIMSGVCP
jgi:hypothetical protein